MCPVHTRRATVTPPLQARPRASALLLRSDSVVSCALLYRRAVCSRRLSGPLFYRLRPGATQALDRLAALRVGGTALRRSPVAPPGERDIGAPPRVAVSVAPLPSALCCSGRAWCHPDAIPTATHLPRVASAVVGGRTHRCRPTKGASVFTPAGRRRLRSFRATLSVSALRGLSGPLFCRARAPAGGRGALPVVVRARSAARARP